VGAAALIHSVDRAELAEAISRRASATEVVQKVLVEVNLSGEAAKHGTRPGEALELARRTDALDGVRVCGLMTMAPFSDDPETSRPFFRQLAGLRDEIADVVPGATGLSMGMSRDFEVAIEEGATIVRVGEAIFGARRR
jgi:pyridoxal phosphate enzyme (YggS family)